MRSFEAYLKRPGHVLLPDNMVPPLEFEKERQNPLLRVRTLWEYWHASPNFLQKKRRVSALLNYFSHKKMDSQHAGRKVHIDIRQLENQTAGDQSDPAPMSVNTCFDRLEISINQTLLRIMRSHLEGREEDGDDGEDTDFDRWVHGQIYRPHYNSI
jgi:hypothetical protein